MICNHIYKNTYSFKTLKCTPNNHTIFWAYLVPLDVDVTRNITAKLCEV